MPSRSRHLVVLALDGVNSFDLATPIEVFRGVRLSGGRPAYEVRVAGPAEHIDAGPIGVRVPHRLDALDGADTVIVPGLLDYTAPPPLEVIDKLREAHRSGARIASICVGAFTLAATGLLDGLRATTHWAAADLLTRTYPAVAVDPRVLFVDEGAVLTSAGAAAGLDLCLHMISNDHGETVAADAARAAVMPLARAGGQAQYIDHRRLPLHEASLTPVLEWLERTPGQLSLDAIAEHANMSTRTLHRRFQEQTGLTPIEWLTRARIRQAQALLESTDRSVDRVALEVGFGSTANFRRSFRRTTGTTPQLYRQAFAGATGRQMG